MVDGQTANRVRHGAPVPAAKILRWAGAVDGERLSRSLVRIHDTDGCLLAIGTCPDNSREALKVEKVLIDQNV